MTCSGSKPTKRFTLKGVNTKLMGNLVRVAIRNQILDYELHDVHSSNFKYIMNIPSQLISRKKKCACRVCSSYANN